MSKIFTADDVINKNNAKTTEAGISCKLKGAHIAMLSMGMAMDQRCDDLCVGCMMECEINTNPKWRIKK